MVNPDSLALIVFRCDASLSIGSGHVMRCRTLARELQRRGAEVVFLCRRQPGDLIALLATEFRVLPLPELPLQPVQADDGSPLTGRELYTAWLGCDQAQDAADCLAALHQANCHDVAWLVVDHYGLDAYWQQLLLTGLEVSGTGTPRLLIIDDLADRPHLADVLLDQNFCGSVTEQRYQELVPKHCCQLLGPHYGLLGPEYAQFHPLVPPRTDVKRVLVFFGGVDPDNLTSRAMEALMAPELVHLAVDVVLGYQSPHRDAVAALVAQRPGTTLHAPLPSLAGLIARADLGIGAGGATTWERACLGLPSLVVTIAANQLPFAQALAQAGHLTWLGDAASVTAQQICQTLATLIAKDAHPTAGCDLVDGWGARRLATVLLGADGLRLRQATAADEALLLRWANDPQVRANSFSPNSIHPDEHRRWLQASWSNPNRLLLIATDTAGCPLGQIRFDRSAALSEDHISRVQVSISLDRAARGQGLGRQILHQGLSCVQERWGLWFIAEAEILTENLASQALFTRAGFVPTESLQQDRVRLCWHSPGSTAPSSGTAGNC